MLLAQLFQNPFSIIAIIVGLIIGITFHEFAHAWVAFRCGDPTAKIEGRLTLNPLAHLDPLGTLFLFIAGFGWGKPVPINPRFFKHKYDELKVAFAGIVMNLIIATIVGIPIRIALAHGQVIDSSPLLQFLNLVVEINILLASFNLIPIPPLDGSHLIEYFLSDQAKNTFNSMGLYILLALVLLDRIGGSSILFTIMEPIMRIFTLITTGTFNVPF